MIYHYIIVPHVSRKILDPNVSKLLNSLLSHAFKDLKKKDVDNVLNILISETERTMIYKRLGIFLLLELGYPVEYISDTIKVTPQTIIRVKMMTNMIPENNKRLLKRRLKAAFTKELISDFVKNFDISYSSFRKKLAKI